MSAPGEKNKSPPTGTTPPPYCIFCLQKVETETQSVQKRRKNKYFTTIERFIGLENSSNSSSPFGLQFCPDCELLVEQFAEQIEALRRVELELVGKIGRIREIMERASAVHHSNSRSSLLKEHHHASTEMRRDRDDNKSVWKQLEEWRQNLIQKCVGLKLTRISVPQEEGLLDDSDIKEEFPCFQDFRPAEMEFNEGSIITSAPNWDDDGDECQTNLEMSHKTMSCFPAPPPTAAHTREETRGLSSVVKAEPAIIRIDLNDEEPTCWLESDGKKSEEELKNNDKRGDREEEDCHDHDTKESVHHKKSDSGANLDAAGLNRSNNQYLGCNGKTCKDCGMVFKTKWAKYAHYYKVHAVGVLKERVKDKRCGAPTCQYKARDWRDVEQHRKSKRCPHRTEWNCQGCQKKGFKSRTAWARHVKSCLPKAKRERVKLVRTRSSNTRPDLFT